MPRPWLSSSVGRISNPPVKELPATREILRCAQNDAGRLRMTGENAGERPRAAGTASTTSRYDFASTTSRYDLAGVFSSVLVFSVLVFSASVLPSLPLAGVFSSFFA